MGDGPDALAECVAKLDSEDEAQWWASEHRMRHGLEPQKVVPPLWAAFA